MSTKRSRPNKRERRRRPEQQLARPWYGHGSIDDELLLVDDDHDQLRLTVTVHLVVRVTREKVLDRFADDVFAARRDALSPDDFAPLAFEAACMEGFDRIASGPAGQVGFLADARAVVAGIPGIAVEDAALTVERTPTDRAREPLEWRGMLDPPDEDIEPDSQH